MSHPKSRELALKLAAKCSVVTNNFRPGVMERWRLGYEQVAAVNPSIIYLAMPMQGATGPHASYIGFGSTIAAISGMVDTAGLPDRAPIGTGTHYPDHVPNPGHALVGLLAAIFHRHRTGEGQYVEVPQIESTINVLGPNILKYSADGELPRRSGNRRPGSVPRGVFPCQGDDSWIAIEVEDDRGWSELAGALGDPDWMAEVDLATLLGRATDIDFVEARLAEETRLHRAEHLAAELQRRGVAASPVQTSRDVAGDRQLASRGFWRQVDHPEMGTLTVNGPPFLAVGEGPRDDPRRPPLLGEHTVEIAGALLGLDPAECARLADDKVFY
jgi:benzylsuccinate CoA-transferase BbsF subunit